MTTLIVVSGLAFEAKIARGPGNLPVYGLDRAKLSCDIEAAIKSGAKAVMSFGTAGGLSREVAAGDVIVPKQVIASDCAWVTHVEWADAIAHALPRVVRGPLFGADIAISTTEAKAHLARQTGAVAVDMESQLAAKIAARYGLPFIVLRVVLDPCHRALPKAALDATRANGTTNLPKLLLSLAKKPGQIPALITLASDAQAARSSLLRCRETLGPLFGFGFSFTNASHLTLDMQ